MTSVDRKCVSFTGHIPRDSKLGVLFVDGGCGLEDESDCLSQEVISAFRLVAKDKGELSALAWAISLLEEYEESDLKIRESLKKQFSDLTVPDQLIEKEYLKDAMIRRLERQLQEKENEIKILKEQKSTYTKQLETNEERIEEYKTKVFLLVSTLSDKDMLVNTLQSLLEPDKAPTHQSLSYSRKTSLDTLNERGGGTGPGDIALSERPVPQSTLLLLMSLYHTSSSRRSHHYQLMINTCWE
ncbi:PREDICTED: cilia- and flagella-associated protein 57-like [Amphimedon queenslandica]|uniref:Uncharacterized protein n=1 Tax=Amphimedon queenslandica TaxID=400682 RepID=A0AAN0JN34_AMPQE|nr:PREDICTED: cilia- and flagella-associated protein 57-like [Amphimedon queenslandica]|eukprot:XP_019858423.1 PREDICTED: cilia- and flagella-associated protein 57-like [Amphimedon queenslandica]